MTENYLDFCNNRMHKQPRKIEHLSEEYRSILLKKEEKIEIFVKLEEEEIEKTTSNSKVFRKQTGSIQSDSSANILSSSLPLLLLGSVIFF